MSELVTTRIREHATRLTLPHLAENLDLLVQRAEADSMGYRDFIDLLLGEELGLREGRRFRTALKLSGLPHNKTLDEFSYELIRLPCSCRYRHCAAPGRADPRPDGQPGQRWRLVRTSHEPAPRGAMLRTGRAWLRTGRLNTYMASKPVPLKR